MGIPKSVVHGDPSAANIRVNGKRIRLLDWDEARVDHIDLDLAALPCSDLAQDRLRKAQAALDAWEAANSWTLEPDYARRRLAALGESSEF